MLFDEGECLKRRFQVQKQRNEGPTVDDMRFTCSSRFILHSSIVLTFWLSIFLNICLSKSYGSWYAFFSFGSCSISSGCFVSGSVFVVAAVGGLSFISKQGTSRISVITVFDIYVIDQLTWLCIVSFSSLLPSVSYSVIVFFFFPSCRSFAYVLVLDPATFLFSSVYSVVYSSLYCRPYLYVSTYVLSSFLYTTQHAYFLPSSDRRFCSCLLLSTSFGMLDHLNTPMDGVLLFVYVLSPYLLRILLLLVYCWCSFVSLVLLYSFPCCYANLSYNIIL